MRQLQCVICEKQFAAKRSDAKTCCDACRRELSRRKDVHHFEDAALHRVGQIQKALQIPGVNAVAQNSLRKLHDHIGDVLDGS